jgi:peptidoglycan/LPS O-acetylase OafA/YrhL
MQNEEAPNPLPILATRLVLLTTATVTALAIAMFFIEPSQYLKWLTALLFLPIALGGLWYLARRSNKPGTAKWFGKVRAGLVGGGVLLATALGFAMTDALGITGENGQLEGRPFLMILPAVVATMAELIGTRLEREAEKDPKPGDD